MQNCSHTKDANRLLHHPHHHLLHHRILRPLSNPLFLLSGPQNLSRAPHSLTLPLISSPFNNNNLHQHTLTGRFMRNILCYERRWMPSAIIFCWRLCWVYIYESGGFCPGDRSETCWGSLEESGGYLWGGIGEESSLGLNKTCRCDRARAKRKERK